MIQQRAMLAWPSISVWTARRYDRAASREVAELHHADAERAGRYNKCLIDVRAPSYEKVVKIARAARRYHEERTLPWAQDGARILSAAMYMEYKPQMERFRAEFEDAVRDFLREYPALKRKAQRELNGLYREEDYPSQEALEGKFAFRLSIMPVPSERDFRVALADAEVSLIRESIASEVEAAVKDAEREKWQRLFAVVSHAVERLSDPDAIFRDSLIENIREAVAILPRLSLTDDAQFDSVVEEVKRKLAGLSPSTLREDLQTRASAARKAAEILEKMRGYF